MDRLEPVEDSRDIDDNSIEANITEVINSTDLDNAVKMGILENVSGKKNHDLWLAPMIVVPKKDNSPRRVIDFSLLNKYCKRSAEVTLDTNRMATAVPVPDDGKEIFFSCLDAWNGK